LHSKIASYEEAGAMAFAESVDIPGGLKSPTQIGLLLILAADLNLKTVWIVEVNTGLGFPLDLDIAALQFG